MVSVAPSGMVMPLLAVSVTPSAIVSVTLLVPVTLMIPVMVSSTK